MVEMFGEQEFKKQVNIWADLLHIHLQVHLQEQQEEELITVDAIGCFEEEEELDEEQVPQEEEAGGGVGR